MNRRLAFWMLLGLAGVPVFVYGGISENWCLFVIGYGCAIVSMFMLASGGWMRGWKR